MNIWKPAKRNNSKVTVTQIHQQPQPIWSDEAAAALPDVVSGLSIRGSDTTMIGQMTHSSDTTGGRRRRTNQPTTPVGLGAGPPTPLQDFGIIPTPSASLISRRQDAWPPQSNNVQMVDNNNRSQASFPPGSPSEYPDNKSTMPFDFEGSRIRSLSNDLCSQADVCHTNRRNRCSSATRNRQNRPRRTDSKLQNQIASTNSSSSPPTRQGFMTIPRERRPSSDRHRETLNNFTVSSSNLPIPGSSYGYQVSNLEALLTEATPTSPANLPMVLASATRLHNTRIALEAQDASAWPFLPLGIIVNAVFKMRDWLYIRTAHGAEGYVPYGVCLPLGILPPSHVSRHRLNGSWELRGPLDLVDVSQRQPKPIASSADPHERGRSRYRRRVITLQSTNQTDLQKLQPPLTFDHRPIRETLDPPTISAGPSHLV